MGLSFWLNHDSLFGTQRGAQGLEIITVAGHSTMLSFLKLLLTIGVGWFSLLCSAVISNVLPTRFVIQTLVFSFIWYLGFLLKPLLYFGYHLVEAISNYTSSSERFYMEEIQNGTLATFFYDVSSFLIKTFQYLEHPWVVKMHLLVFFGIFFWFCLRLISNLRISSRDLPKGLIVMGGRVCGRISIV